MGEKVTKEIHVRRNHSWDIWIEYEDYTFSFKIYRDMGIIDSVLLFTDKCVTLCYPDVLKDQKLNEIRNDILSAMDKCLDECNESRTITTWDDLLEKKNGSNKPKSEEQP